MSDAGRYDESDATARPRKTRRDGGEDDPAENAVTDEAPADDASEAAEQFSRDEGEAPSG